MSLGSRNDWWCIWSLSGTTFDSFCRLGTQAWGIGPCYGFTFRPQGAKLLSIHTSCTWALLQMSWLRSLWPLYLVIRNLSAVNFGPCWYLKVQIIHPYFSHNCTHNLHQLVLCPFESILLIYPWMHPLLTLSLVSSCICTLSCSHSFSCCPSIWKTLEGSLLSSLWWTITSRRLMWKPNMW